MKTKQVLEAFIARVPHFSQGESSCKRLKGASINCSLSCVIAHFATVRNLLKAEPYFVSI